MIRGSLLPHESGTFIIADVVHEQPMLVLVLENRYVRTYRASVLTRCFECRWMHSGYSRSMTNLYKGFRWRVSFSSGSVLTLTTLRCRKIF
jgi:hypothetical protein